MKPHVATYYMHTLSGKPAFYDGRQICFMKQGGWLATSLAKIREEQTASAKWREARGYKPLYPAGYLRVRVPA